MLYLYPCDCSWQYRTYLFDPFLQNLCLSDEVGVGGGVEWSGGGVSLTRSDSFFQSCVTYLPWPLAQYRDGSSCLRLCGVGVVFVCGEWRCIYVSGGCAGCGV